MADSEQNTSGKKLPDEDERNRKIQGTRLKLAMLEAGETTASLSAEICLSPATIDSWMRGHAAIPIRHHARLASLLGKAVNFLQVSSFQPVSARCHQINDALMALCNNMSTDQLADLMQAATRILLEKPPP